MVYTEISNNKWKTAGLMTFMLLLIIGIGYIFAWRFNSPGLLVLAVMFSIGMSLVSYFFSDKIVLGISGAREIKKSEDPELFNVVENLSITAGLPSPKIYLIQDTAMNAFATGRDPKHAVVVITSGLRTRLTKQELEGVMAHELSHIGNYDIRLTTIIVVLVGVITLLSDWLLRISFYGGGRRRDNDSGNANAIIAVIGLAAALLAPIAATLTQLAISRKREYLADASGVLLTRYPQGLASALQKLSNDTEPLEVANKATAHLYIVNPLKGKTGGVSWFANLFMTHPPINERIKKLNEMTL